MTLPSKEILLSDLDKNPKLLDQFEKNWHLINSLSSEDFIAWSEQADPIQLQNFHLYGEYRKRKTKTPSVLRNILNHQITKSILDFLLKIGTVALFALLITGAGALFIAFISLIIWIGIKIYIYNNILAFFYAVFMMMFVILLPQAFFNY